jgi:hypothetical protein
MRERTLAILVSSTTCTCCGGFARSPFGKEGGGIFDPRANVWRPLTDLPHYDLAGIIAADRATYEYASGWVLDTRTGDFLNIAPHPDGREVYDQTLAEGPALSLVVFGGQSWSGAAGQLRNEMWRWTPPHRPEPSK